MCGQCGGKDHSKSVCLSTDSGIMLTQVVEEPFGSSDDEFANGVCEVAGGSVTDALMARDYTSESELPMFVGNDLGVGEETWVLDNSASPLMTPNSDFMFNYHQHSGRVKTAGGRLLPIEGSGSIMFDNRSDTGMVPLHLTNILHVPSLCHNLLSLRVLADKGHTYVGNQHGITLNL